MGQHSDRAREALLDAAEELFARHGIDAVSDRRIAEFAGTANHSAVKYHFGGRDELLRALLSRHVEPVDKRRKELIADLGEDAELWDMVACRILPWIEHLASLPVPSWRARFLFQVRTVPSVAEILSDSLARSEGFDNLLAHMKQKHGEIPPAVMRARSGILEQVVLGICSEYEGRMQEGTEQGNWESVGYLLIDSITGMLSAPVSHPLDFKASSNDSSLI